MTVLELYELLNKRIPTSLSCDWDNDGLMCCPDPNRPARRVLVCLDATAPMIDKAIAEGFDVILTHHPLVFHKLPAIDPRDQISRRLIRLIQAGVAVMSFHTRLDALSGGVNDTLAERLGLLEVTPCGEGGIGRVGHLPTPVSLFEFAEAVKQALGVPFVVGADAGVPVYRVAVLGGNGSDDVRSIEDVGADTYLSGEIAAHHLTDAPERGMNLVAAGHFHTENPVCKALAEMVRACDAKIETVIENSNLIRVF